MTVAMTEARGWNGFIHGILASYKFFSQGTMERQLARPDEGMSRALETSPPEGEFLWALLHPGQRFASASCAFAD